MSKTSWKKFPYPSKVFVYDGEDLKENWEQLHNGDREPFPESDALQQAWRHYHAGEFRRAYDLGLEQGVDGYNVANKAAMIYANGVEDDPSARLALLQEVVARAEELQRVRPDAVNGWYYHVYALGRYSQAISVVKALTQGLAGKLRASIEKALELEPNHPDALVAFGSYHAEIVSKVGGMIAGLTYGAKKDAAVSYFERSLSLNPDAPGTRLEAGRGLIMLNGRKSKEGRKLIEEAVAAEPIDAMDRLDIEAAKVELESLG